jgi:hypothetical protein
MTHYTGGCVGPRVGLEVLVKRKILPGGSRTHVVRPINLSPYWLSYWTPTRKLTRGLILWTRALLDNVTEARIVKRLTLFNPKYLFCIHRSLKLVHILKQMKPIHTLISYTYKMHFNGTIPSTPRSLKSPPSFWGFRQKFYMHCDISSSHGGEYDVQSCLLGYTAV